MMAQTATRIGASFARCKAERRAAFVAYLTAGDPTPAYTAPLVLALERGGADIIELGVPFSDPIADGPAIQRASERALRAGMNLPLLLETVQEIRRHSQIPLLLFSYLNPLLRYGFEELAARASDAGVDGVLLTDLSVEEAERPVSVLRARGLDTVFLAAPTSTDRRLRLVAEHSSGFIYLVSRTGVTGERASLSDAVKPLVGRLRQQSDLPLAVGFGIAAPAQVAETASIADGVVVGSALVNCIGREAAAPDLVSKLENFTRELTSPLKNS
ncbi:MAG TPA: tryptophan synthase subunit alpha [Bryobacteraceae bacterium]